MKIGILLWELDIAGGTQRQALCLARELSRMGDEVTVYCVKADSGKCYPELMSSLRVEVLKDCVGFEKAPTVPIPFVHRFTGNDLETRCNRRIADLLPQDLDLLNVHDTTVYSAAYFWKKRTGRPVVWMMNDLPWLLDCSWRRGRPWKVFLRLLDGKEWVRRRHCRYVRSFEFVLVLDRRERDRLSESAGKAAIPIVSGLDLDAFPFHPRPAPSAAEPFRILSNAIFFPHRRLEDIVAALEILHRRGIGFHWTHIGTDVRDLPYARRIYAEVARAGLSSFVDFLGEVPEDRLCSLFREVDAFLFPNAPQTWGLAVFQAMACGTPAIVSRGAGASEVLTHGKNALLVDPFSPAQIADAVQRLRENEELWKSLHVESRRFVEENIRWNLYAKSMKAVFMRATRACSPGGDAAVASGETQ